MPYAADPTSVEQIVVVMRTADEGIHDARPTLVYATRSRTVARDTAAAAGVDDGGPARWVSEANEVHRCAVDW